MKASVKTWCRLFLVGVFAAASGCATSGSALGQSTVAVAVHGVNYTNQTFSYIVKDPENESNSAGGELVSRFSAGGLMCCYALPAKWRPGLKVIVKSTHWLNEKVNGNLPEFKKDFIVEIPPYKEPGELWVSRLPDGSVNVVSSDLSPGHVNWPGNIKGWPIPNDEYMLEKRLSALKEAEDDLRAFNAVLSEVKSDPLAYSTRLWPKWQKWNAREYLKFSGPQDPALHDYLLRSYEERTLITEKKIDALKKAVGQ